MQGLEHSGELVTFRAMAEEEVAAWTMRMKRPFPKMDGSESSDLDDEWRYGRMDDPEPLSDEAAEEGAKQQRRKHWESGEDSNEMSMDPVDG